MNNSKQSRETLPRTWFLGKGYTPARHSRLKRLIYINEEADILDPYGRPVPKYKNQSDKMSARYRHGNQYWVIFVGRDSTIVTRVKVADIMLATFIREKKKGEEADHINGDALDDRLSNLRIVKKETNCRDGGFVRKLEKQHIDPKMYPSDMLLRFFKRMARYKTTHTEQQYRKLTREDLLKKLFKGTGYKVSYSPSEHEKYLARWEEMVSNS